MADERDRFGEKIRDKEKGQEQTYFAQRDQELLDRMRRQKEEEARAHVAMHCPRCGKELQERVEHAIRIDEWPGCGGLWLDKGELEHLAKRENEGWFGRLFRARVG
jgi:uncharacterized protein